MLKDLKEGMAIITYKIQTIREGRNIKKNQLKLQVESMITTMNNSPERPHSRSELSEERVSELKDRRIPIV